MRQSADRLLAHRQLSITTCHAHNAPQTDLLGAPAAPGRRSVSQRSLSRRRRRRPRSRARRWYTRIDYSSVAAVSSICNPCCSSLGNLYIKRRDGTARSLLIAGRPDLFTNQAMPLRMSARARFCALETRRATVSTGSGTRSRTPRRAAAGYTLRPRTLFTTTLRIPPTGTF